MKLYEINEAMDTLLASLTVDPETGEVPVDVEDIVAQIDELAMERTKVLEYLAKLVLNVRSDIESIDKEIDRLKDRKESLKKREQSLMRVLDRECGGEKTDLGVATVSYRASEVTEISDEPGAITWLVDNNYNDCVKQREPTIDKTELKRLLKDGVEIPGCTVTKKINCSLK